MIEPEQNSDPFLTNTSTVMEKHKWAKRINSHTVLFGFLRLCLQRCLRVLYLASWYSLNSLNLSTIAFLRHAGRERLKHCGKIIVHSELKTAAASWTIRAKENLRCCRFWPPPASRMAAGPQRRNICGRAAWWTAGWQPEPAGSWLWSGCSALAWCKRQPGSEPETRT